ncbi:MULTISPECIES: hypothetical protein [Bacteria]|uniref:Prophage PSSB64-02 n=1 Tax=Pseudomonas azotoformans TaxID=47878 RepID=A0A4Q0HY92_PSEAZ|nr:MULTISPECIES: hypothetical protein [Pseudomonas]MBJ2224910.1 hypothetical protein [Pseudomonas sp. MF7451]MBJ2303850.1 hypothetical protein [Pseudomonas sp. MF2846]MBK3492285.1 hypothetical protein [Pseudomonas sp. MF2857]RXE54168.1 hypothetical protein B4O85_04820 [Pseudomonas azotoformans]
MALQLTKKDQAAAGARWVEFDKDTKVLLAGIDNAEYQVGLERMRRRIARNDARFEEGQVGVVAGELTEHQNHAMLLAHFIVKDWSGVLDAEGNPLKYGPSVAAELLENSLDFFLFVLRGGSSVATESAEELKDTVGKPSPVSSGKKSGRAARPRSGA